MMLAAALLATAAFTRPLERVSSMDPALGRTIYDAHATQLVYESPLAVAYGKEPYELVPDFCELPEVSADGLTYVFRLRRPLRTVDGHRFVAEDLRRSIERLRDPSVVSPNGWILKEVDTIRATDEETLEIRLKRPVHYFPWLMSMPATSVVGPNGEGTGAFRLADWTRNHAMTFERRVHEAGGFDVVRYLVIDDASTQWLMFLKGELDFLGEVSRDNWDSVVDGEGRLRPALAAQGFSLHAMPTLESLYVGINMRDPVLGGNRKLRQALNAAFDGPAWEKFYNRRIRRSDTPVPPGVAGRLETPFAYAFDLTVARRLIAEAGYPDGIDPKTDRRLTLTLSIGRASQESREAGELMAAFYAQIGVKLELAFMTWDAFLKAVNEGRTQLFRMGWVGDYPDAQNFLQLFYSPNANPGPNHSDYASREYDVAYEAALAARTAAERETLWRRCQEILREDCPWVFTHYNISYTLTRPRVGNYHSSDFPYGNERHYRVKRP